MVRYLQKLVLKQSWYIYSTLRYQTLKKVVINISQINPSPEKTSKPNAPEDET